MAIVALVFQKPFGRERACCMATRKFEISAKFLVGHHTHEKNTNEREEDNTNKRRENEKSQPRFEIGFFIIIEFDCWVIQ